MFWLIEKIEMCISFIVKVVVQSFPDPIVQSKNSNMAEIWGKSFSRNGVNFRSFSQSLRSSQQLSTIILWRKILIKIPVREAHISVGGVLRQGITHWVKKNRMFLTVVIEF